MPAQALTSDEFKVIQWLPTPLSFAEIGERVAMPAAAVRATAIGLYRRLGVASRQEAVHRCLRLGLIVEAHPSLEPQEDLHAFLDDMEEAIFHMKSVRGAHGRIIDFEYQYCNRAALTVLGRSRDAVVGRRLLDLFPSHITDGLFDAYVHVTESGEPLRYEFSFDEGGVAGDFEIVVSRHGDGHVTTGHDIGARKRRERDLVLVRDQLQHALTSRILIEQAKGYITARTGMNTETAFLALRRHARDNNKRLVDVAQSVVAGDLQIPIQGSR